MQHRSRAVAIILAVLSVSYLPLSLHNFYLGYYGRGAAAIALLLVGIFLLALGFPSLFFGTGSLMAISFVGLAMLAGWFLWQLSDLVRIITGSLKPRDGEYNHRAPAASPIPETQPTR
ncbi:MAG: hypothetical protein EOO56_14295 [Hymenobacter sp.]|nr:MAG: hypothetical protein EOO56_14295 [Hymenobacter sp.]